MTSSTAQARPGILPTMPARDPADVRPKRPRSDSASSTSSSMASSFNDGSIFSHTHLASSNSTELSSDSSCSTPASKAVSPSQRPAKVCRCISTSESTECEEQEESPSDAASRTSRGQESQSSDSESSSSDTSTSTAPTSEEPPSQSAPSTSKPCAGRTVFVDCLVDATVHSLNMVWHAPVRKSIAFLRGSLDANSIRTEMQGPIQRPCRCPIEAPICDGLPLDVFVRETLRRSRTSCSTLQAALLYCKRISGEVVRKRAQLEGVSLSAEDQACLASIATPHILHGGDPALFASLSDGLDCVDDASRLAKDPLLCSRRTFLAAVVISSKFLQDQTYSNLAWSKISGLDVDELGGVERRLLDALTFNLAATDDEWARWLRYLSGTWKADFELCTCRDSLKGLAITEPTSSL